MMYAIGKGVQQDYRDAGKWFLTAAEAGNTRAAINYVSSLRTGMGNLRTDPELTQRWAKFLAAHPEYSPVPGRRKPALRRLQRLLQTRLSCLSCLPAVQELPAKCILISRRRIVHT